MPRSSLQTLRTLRWLTSTVLCWFVISVGTAIAAPWVQPTALELICSGSGSITVVKADDGTPEGTRHTLDCPLCIQGGAPPPPSPEAPPLDWASTHTLRPLVTARIVVRSAAPLPPRGPPTQALFAIV